jgi:cytochrome P450
MSELANDLVKLVRFEDPKFFLDDPYPVLQRLRQEEPVFYYEPMDIWLISKYEDIRFVGSRPDLFSSNEGIHVSDFRLGNKAGEATKAFFRPEAENLSMIGPPRHNALRAIVNPTFSPKVIARMREQVREMCRDLLRLIEPGKTVNWSEDVSEPLPLMVIAILMGLPLDDLPLIKYFSDELIKIGFQLDDAEMAEILVRFEEMYVWFEKLLTERAANPREDLVTTLGQARNDGLISTDTVYMLLSGIMVAGNETTRNTINGAAILLSEHPEQMKLLAAEPDLVKNATEEFLRYVTPVRGFGRTATQDMELRGRKLAAGQHVFNFFMSGNRDEEAFEQSAVFDIKKKRNNPNLAFGFGQHFCIGAGLARMEINILFEELIKRFSKVQIVGTPFRDKVLQYNMWSDVYAVFN